MVWLYERGDATMTIETRFNRDSQNYELIWHDPDGTRRIETFRDESSFRTRILAVSKALAEQRWQQSGAPTVDPDGWRL